ncbi:MAG: elongation factor P [Deltaproteobacteria bacterium]|nr:elongation factor P [Deltaproteobacteria bacterium]
METSSFRKGLKILHNGVPYVIIDFQHVKPGKGNAFTRTRIKNLQTAAVLEITYRSGEKLEDPEVEERSMTFLYEDGGIYHLMDAKTFDQVEITGEFLGDTKNYLLPDMVCDVVFWKARPLTIQIPQHVELKIAHCEPGARGDTATNVTKPATLETGAVVDVPIFINVGDKVKIETDTGRYIERTSIGSGS